MKERNGSRRPCLPSQLLRYVRLLARLLDDGLKDASSLRQSTSHEGVQEPWPGLLGGRPPLEEEAGPQGGVLHKTVDMDSELTQPEQGGGRALHAEKWGLGKMSFDCITLSSPASERREEVLLPHVQQGSLQRCGPGVGVRQEVADGDGVVGDVEDLWVEPQLTEDWRGDETDLAPG